MPPTIKVTTPMLIAQIGALLGFACYGVFLTTLQQEWQLLHVESGLIASAFFLGYMLFVPFATVLTDRIDARQIFILGGFLAIIGLLGMGFIAQGFFSASFFMAIQGAGLAGTYMPGLKILSDRIQSGEVTRHISFYTAFFGLGTGLSYLISGLLLDAFGWRNVFILIALGPFISVCIVFFFIQPIKKHSSHSPWAISWTDLFPVNKWREVLKNKNSTQFIFGYTVHNLELFASRSWLVAFFTFCAASSGSVFFLSATALAALVNISGVISSILGNEMALKIGRKKWITFAMITSSILGLCLGASSEFGWWLIVPLAIAHAIFITADSATLTAGLVVSTQEHVKGAAMGLHSLLGFGGGLLGPAIFGLVLDASGNPTTSISWILAYGSIVIWSVIFIAYQYRQGWHLKK